MLIEAIKQPIRYRYRDGREILFRPGTPTEVPDLDAARILEKAPGKIRPVPPPKRDWLREWREVAEISSGLTRDDVRLPSVMAALGVCDAAFVADDWAGFQEAKIGVIRAKERAIQPPGAKNH